MPIIHQLSVVLHDTIPSLILLNFILLIVLICFNWHAIKRFLFKIDKKTWCILALIFFIALLMRILIPAHQHVMYIDEQWYMEAGKNMLQTGSQDNYSKSIAWPFILRIAFGIFGISNWTAIYTSVLLGSLTIFTIFFMTFSITKRKDIGLVSAIFLALSPAHIRWSATAETNIASLFFITLTIFFCFLYYHSLGSNKERYFLLWLSLVSLAFTAQFRPENYVFIILFLLGCIIYKRKFILRNISHTQKCQYSNLKVGDFDISGRTPPRRIPPHLCWGGVHIDIRFILPWLILIFLSFANLVQVMDYQTSTNWIESDSAGEQTGTNWSFGNLLYNSAHYGIYIFNSEYQPALFSVLLLLGIFYACHKQKKILLFLLSWLSLLWFIYFFSWFQTLGGNSAVLAKTRFFMSFYPVTAILAGYGILLIRDLVSSGTNIISLRINKPIIAKSIMPFAVILLAIMLIPYSLNAASWYNNPSHKLETRIPELAEKDIPPDCLIIANQPAILKSTTDLNVVDIDKFLADSEYQKEIFNKSQCILFFEDYCCLEWNTYGSREKCDKIKDTFLLKPYISYNEGGQNYTFYEISVVISKNTKL